MSNESDVILYLLPQKGEGFDLARVATAMPENRKRLIAAPRTVLHSTDSLDRQKREGTEPAVEYGLLDNTDRLVVRFSDGARTCFGVVAGCASNADLRLPKVPGVSNHHFAFTFDDDCRLILRDLGSRCGTKVTYDKEESERQVSSAWLLESPAMIGNRAPVLNVTDLVQFKIIVPQRDTSSQDHIDRVRRFKEGVSDPEEMLKSSVLSSLPSTTLPTGQQTPVQALRPILWRKQIGKGEYGLVHYVWNATTGAEYVVKAPRPDRDLNAAVWKREIDIMRSISHEHIVAFRSASFDPFELELEFVPGGSLQQYNDLSSYEMTQVLRQLSSALVYLHSRQPPITHRDIKPDNILVAERAKERITVKFSDFGLSKAAECMRTVCGSPLYLAPEIWSGEAYEKSADIWSLGIVIAERDCGLRQAYAALDDERRLRQDKRRRKHQSWPVIVRDKVERLARSRDDGLLWLTYDNMLLQDPDERSSADYCEQVAYQLQLRMLNAMPLECPLDASVAEYQLSSSSSSHDNLTTILDRPSRLAADEHLQEGNAKSLQSGRSGFAQNASTIILDKGHEVGTEQQGSVIGSLLWRSNKQVPQDGLKPGSSQSRSLSRIAHGIQSDADSLSLGTSFAEGKASLSLGTSTYVGGTA